MKNITTWTMPGSGAQVQILEETEDRIKIRYLDTGAVRWMVKELVFR